MPSARPTTTIRRLVTLGFARSLSIAMMFFCRSHCGSPLRAAVVDAPPARRALHQRSVAHAKRATAASGSQVRGLVRASAALSVRRAVHTGTPCQDAVARYLILGVAGRVMRRLLASAPERRP